MSSGVPKVVGFRTMVAFVVLGLSVPFAASALTPEQQLGALLYADVNLSVNRDQACTSCHSTERLEVGDPPERLGAPGFVDPDNVRQGSAVSNGSVPGRFGRLNAPSAAYAAFSPHFHWDGAEGLYVGGQFWNGRAASLTEQAAGPPLNPDEMAMPSQWAVVSRLKENPQYVKRFESVYGLDLDAIPARELAPRDARAPPGAAEAFRRMTEAIAAFERSRVFSPFTSKYDYVIAGRAQLSEHEALGLDLFNDKALCSECHVSDVTLAPGGGELPPLFTDYTYDNIGLPRNVNLPGNPDPDPGLAGNPRVVDPAPERGKHKVMTLRNIAITPPYGHNGVFATLEQITHFYNARDTLERVCSDINDPGFGKNCWPAPEIAENVNTEELGDLDLTPEEEAAIVAFMKTLTDGYPEWGNDPSVPPGTPSPYADVPFPPMP
jgi:cytochrome c peroxidase